MEQIQTNVFRLIAAVHQVLFNSIGIAFSTNDLGHVGPRWPRLKARPAGQTVDPVAGVRRYVPGCSSCSAELCGAVASPDALPPARPPPAGQRETRNVKIQKGKLNRNMCPGERRAPDSSRRVQCVGGSRAGARRPRPLRSAPAPSRSRRSGSCASS